MKYTIIILHGWGLSKKRFEPLLTELVRLGADVRSIDLPGFGESKSPKKPYTLTDYAEALHEYVEKEQIKYPILMGHSFGGRVSLRYNTLHPKNVRALILTGTPGYTPVSRKKLFLFITIAKLGKGVLSIPVLSFFNEWVRKWYYYVVGAKEFYRAEGTMRQTFKNIVSEPLDEDMKAVSAPTLLLWGEYDLIVPVRIAVRMHETMHHSILQMIPKADHGVPFKDPRRFSEKVMEFVRSLPELG